MNTFFHYDSTFGTTIVIDRPEISGVTLDSEGRPSSLVSGEWAYLTMLSISASEYQRHKPDLVIHRLADRTLLAAPKVLLDALDPSYSPRWGMGYQPRVEHLLLLTQLPPDMPEA